MMNEFEIDKLMQPLINRQEQINMTILTKIAERVKAINTILPSDVYKLEQLLKTGEDVREINRKIAELTRLQEKEIKKIIKRLQKMRIRTQNHITIIAKNHLSHMKKMYR